MSSRRILWILWLLILYVAREIVSEKHLLCKMLSKCKLSSYFDNICVILNSEIINVG